MRVRDLKWYILATFILLVSYAAIAVCYYLSIKNGKVQNSMKELGLEVTKQDDLLQEELISQYYTIYSSDVNNELVYNYNETGQYTENGTPKLFETLPDQGSVSRRRALFNNMDPSLPKVIYSSAYVFEEAVDSTGRRIQNNKYYFYFAKTITDDLNNQVFYIHRMSAENFYSFATTDMFVYTDYDKTVTYSNIEGVNVLDSVTSLLGESFEEAFKDGVLNSVISFRGGEDHAISIIKSDTIKAYDVDGLGVSNIYFATAINIQDTYLGVAWVYQQAIIFYVAGVVIMAAMLLLFILGVRKTSQLLRADRHALQKTEAIVLRINTDGKIIFTNKTFKKIYGISREVDLSHFIDTNTGEPILKTIKQNKAFISEVPLDDMRDNVRYFQLSPLYISKSYYLMGTDVTLDYNESQDLRNLSGHNEVTGCENGFILSTKFEKIRTEMYPGQDICFIECNIHKYNDLITIFGRTTYNLALVEFLKILREVFQDLEIYHIDDSKFMIIYPNVQMSEVTDSVNRLLDTLRRPITIRANNIYIDAKIVAYNLKEGATYDDITTASTEVDETSAKIKNIALKDIQVKLDLAYRNIENISSKDYVIYEPAMDGIILATDEMDRDIETGLIDQEFQMWLQPQFDIFNNRIDGFEALIRWMNPKYRDKSPQLFIELAEKRGHMLEIGRFVIRESFKLAKRIEPYGVHVSVNISPVQLLQVGFVQQLIDEFNKNQLKPGAIAIEITETLLMGSFKLVAEKLKLLREAGFHIHLDDFCTGYSSMLYLKDLPVDTLKIDKEFTKYIVNNKFNENIVRTICSLGNSLDLDLICEGVETQEQSDMVKKMGCRVIQGWLIGKAMPYDQAIDLLEKYNTKK